ASPSESVSSAPCSSATRSATCATSSKATSVSRERSGSSSDPPSPGRGSTVRVPIGWLAEHVDLPAGITVEDLDTAFVRLGLEVEEIHRTPVTTGPLVVGRVLEIEELTGFKKPIRFAQVDVGEA